VEGVPRGAVDVGAELDRAAGVVVGRALHGEQGGAGLLVQAAGLLRGGRARAHGLPGAVQGDTGRPHHAVQAGLLQPGGVEGCAPRGPAAGAGAERAPTVCRARCRVIPAARIMRYRPVCSSRSVSRSSRPDGRKLLSSATGWPWVLRSRSRWTTSAPSARPSAAATSADAGTVSLLTTRVAGLCPAASRSS